MQEEGSSQLIPTIDEHGGKRLSTNPDALVEEHNLESKESVLILNRKSESSVPRSIENTENSLEVTQDVKSQLS